MEYQNLPVVFGSQLIDKNTSTPYSDATQVRTLIKKTMINSF